MRRFVVPKCDNHTVSIAQEHLDRAPESVLTIAAQNAPSDSAISLKDWPDADAAVLQVVTACISGNNSKEIMGKVSGHQLSQALEYFNLPECMWPTGMYIIRTLTVKYDKVAKPLMATIKDDMKRLVANDTDYAGIFTKKYYLQDGPHGLSLEQYPYANIKISKALERRLTDLAAAECLDIEFTTVSRRDYDGSRHEYGSFNVTVRIP